MDLKELFGGNTTIRVKYKGHTTHHEFRTPTNDQDLEYRRRSAKVNVKGKHIETSDSALNAPLWLYSQIIDRVLVENGNGHPEEVPAEVVKDIPNRVKLEAIGAFLSDVEREENETIPNS